MTNLSTKNSIIIAALLVAIGIAGRLLPHLPNMTPITAIALFSTAFLSLRYSAAIFLVTMVLTDAIIGTYQWQIMLAVYGCFLVAVVIGLFVRKYKSTSGIFIGAFGSSVLFFAVTNWAVWLWSGMYAHTWAGFVECYTMAIPFFKNSLAGDMLYTGLLFGLVYFLNVYILKTPSWYNSRIIRANQNIDK